jgi:hypothetical protein
MLYDDVCSEEWCKRCCLELNVFRRRPFLAVHRNRSSLVVHRSMYPRPKHKVTISQRQHIPDGSSDCANGNRNARKPMRNVSRQHPHGAVVVCRLSFLSEFCVLSQKLFQLVGTSNLGRQVYKYYGNESENRDD